MSVTRVTTDSETAHRFGMHEVSQLAAANWANPYLDVRAKVTFVRPDGSAIVVDAFYDGGTFYAARAYCDQAGRWSWSCESNDRGLAGAAGEFQVVPSDLKGKLRIHPQDSHQFARDDGSWFLHIGDTAYRYVVDMEPRWREYIDQAARMGATKVRTWFCRGRSDVQALFGEGRQSLDLGYWREIDRRVRFAYENHPDVMLQLIPYGEDTAELLRHGEGDPMAQLVARYAQARFSAYPNVTWCVSNDREIVRDDDLVGRRVPEQVIHDLGAEMAAREPWGTLITNHQARWEGYSFCCAPWSDIITLEDLDQVDGREILEYRRLGESPVVLDEDRYETYRGPQHHRFYFRRLMWASLLSGGHATYGGLRTHEVAEEGSFSIDGYYDAVRDGRLDHGADDFVHIHGFFRHAGLTLVGMEPADDLVGSRPRRFKCIQGDGVYIAYLANPSSDSPEVDGEDDSIPTTTIRLPEGSYRLRWYDPRTGHWAAGRRAEGGVTSLVAPAGGDWICLIRVD
jgi:hypothetical protein